VSGRPYDTAILPKQAQKIAEVTAETGAAVGLSQSGSTITIHVGGGVTIEINARGETPVHPNQEQFPC